MDNAIERMREELGDFRVLMRKIPSFIVAIFVISVVIMNLMANKELFATEYIAIDCGTTLSWIPFLCMDIICASFGPKAGFKLSAVTVAVNFSVCIAFKLLSLAPGNWGAYYDALESTASVAAAEEANAALNNTIGGCWYVVVGSCLAMLVGSLVNSGVFRIAQHINREGKGFRAFAFRSYISTFAGQLFDNFVFTVTVSHWFFGWSMKQVIICSITCAVFELLLEIIFSPIGYAVARNWERDGVGVAYLERPSR